MFYLSQPIAGLVLFNSQLFLGRVISLSAFVPAGQTFPRSCTQLQILIINSASVPGGQLENPQLHKALPVSLK